MKHVEFFTHLRWHAARVRLQCLRDALAREHPLTIFDAVFKFAAKVMEGEPPAAVVFHPLDVLPRVIRKGYAYDIELIFPRSSLKTCDAFLEGLRRWLGDPSHNFDLLEAAPVRERSLYALYKALPPLQGNEVCLDFLTPLSIRPLTSRTVYRFNGQTLLNLVSNRLSRWYGAEAVEALEYCRTAFTSAEILPWFWEYEEYRHNAKSSPGQQFVCGMQGPLYVRGNIEALLAPLLIMQDLHIGPHMSSGQGAYRLLACRPFFDRLLAESAQYAVALAQCRQVTDLPVETGEEDAARIERLRDLCSSGNWQPDSGLHGGLSPDGMLVHRALARMLGPSVQRMLPEGTAGWNPWKPDAAVTLREAARRGMRRLIRLSLPDVLANIPKEAAAERLNAFLPQADAVAHLLLSKAVFMSGGLPLSSPLLPLWEALLLAPTLHSLSACGVYAVYQGGDLLIPVESTEAATPALGFLEKGLADFGLQCGRDAVEILPNASECGVEDEISSPCGRRPLYVLQLGGFVGIDGDSLLVRQKEGSENRIPLHTVSGVMLHGAGFVSVRLVQRCVAEDIPITFCKPSGWPLGTLPPSSQKWYTRIGAHTARYSALSEKDRVEAARVLVRAKMCGAEMWLLPRLANKVALRTALARSRCTLDRAASVQQVLGVEGAFARLLYPMVNGLVLEKGFHSRCRVPHERRDRWNALLDAANSLLFSRLFAQVQAEGLNPYLGLLHSPEDRYPSLVADIQELFRHRMDQLAVDVVNQRAVQVGHFENKNGRLTLEGEGYNRLIRAFERFLDTRFARERFTLRTGMRRQVIALRRWAEEGGNLPLMVQPCSDNIAPCEEKKQLCTSLPTI